MEAFNLLIIANQTLMGFDFEWVTRENGRDLLGGCQEPKMEMHYNKMGFAIISFDGDENSPS